MLFSKTPKRQQKKKQLKDPFKTGRYNESGLPFVRASRTLITNTKILDLLGFKGYLYFGGEELDAEVSLEDYTYTDLESFLIVIINNILELQAAQQKLDQVDSLQQSLALLESKLAKQEETITMLQDDLSQKENRLGELEQINQQKKNLYAKLSTT